MNAHQLKTNLAENTRKLRHQLAIDLQAEYAHIAEPAQCGSIVQRHFDGIVVAIYLFIALFLIAAVAGIAVYTAF